MKGQGEGNPNDVLLLKGCPMEAGPRGGSWRGWLSIAFGFLSGLSVAELPTLHGPVGGREWQVNAAGWLIRVVSAGGIVFYSPRILLIQRKDPHHHREIG